MTKTPNRFKRWIAPVLLGVGLSLTPAVCPPAHAQAPEETADPNGEKGRPLDGYLATLTLVLLALFLVGKSARR
jgi:hypothetical protein